MSDLKMMKYLEKMNNRLINFETNIDIKLTNLDNKVTNLENKVTNLEKNIKVIKDNLTYLNNHIKNDDYILELEMNEVMKKKLLDNFKGYTIKDLSNEFKTIKNPIDSSGKLMEFDGIFLLSPNNFDINVKSRKSSKKYLSNKKIFVIVEAKKQITKDKIEYKLNQREILLKLIHISKNINITENEIKKILNIIDEKQKNNNSSIKSFKKTLEHNKFNEVDEVYLYMGGVIYDDYTNKFIDDNFKYFKRDETNKNLTYKNVLKSDIIENDNFKKYIGFIKISGNRFKVEDNISMKQFGGFLNLNI